MKIKIDRQKLLNNLSFVSQAISSNPTVAILENILLEVENNKLTLFATDLEIGIVSTIECEATDNIETVIPSSLLQKYLDNLDQNTIELEITSKKLFIKTDEKEMELSTYRSEEFPERQKFKSKEPIEIEQSELKYLINKTNFAVSQNSKESRETLKGLKFEVDASSITTVGTNTFRLAYDQGVIVDNDLKLDLLIPYQATKILNKQLSDGIVEMYMNNNMIKFDIENYEIISRTIEGTYPDYNKVIPDENSAKVEVDKNELKLALKRSKLFDENDVVSLDISETIEISELNSDFGHNLEKIDTEKFEGVSFQTNLDANYLLDAISKIDSDNVIVEGQESSTPLILKDKVDDEWLYMVMPVRG